MGAGIAATSADSSRWKVSTVNPTVVSTSPVKPMFTDTISTFEDHQVYADIPFLTLRVSVHMFHGTGGGANFLPSPRSRPWTSSMPLSLGAMGSYRLTAPIEKTKQ